ncbi:nitroreductase [Mycolicibacterium duvalii]|uniref:nitroreductase family deazaflavin-dependent oxidoreductase n=1 Tax=Mycolicibacterium duvalii TaxID=39688 RepID=UPI000BEEFB20|nr:nitroreductase family deazaflavin-dependent oxidoreductase [Mycolicibacterium duvalii]PEG42610.1 nitroreductase [Mycolicibacterium duvalii]
MPTRSARNVVRTFNKHVLNPVMLLLAGRRHWYATAIRHTGRTTGTVRTTPVVAERVPDGFLTPLPYGTDVDWLRNVVASGEATITVGGRSFDVVNPQIIGADVAAEQLTPRRRRAFARFGVEHFVKFSLATDSEAHHGN